jgi:hypothetical protein
LEIEPLPAAEGKNCLGKRGRGMVAVTVAAAMLDAPPGHLC